MTDAFSSPASGKFDAKAENGHLLLITPTKYLENVTTVNGVKDAVEADIVVLDEGKDKAPEGDPRKIDGARLFGGVLIAATKSFVGKGIVLGRLGQGVAKPGQNAPWVLNDYDEADAQLARDYIAKQAPQF